MKKILLYICITAMLCIALTGCDGSVNEETEGKTNSETKKEIKEEIKGQEETKEQTENESEETAKSEEHIAIYDLVLENLYDLIGSSETDHLPEYMIQILEIGEDPYECFGYSYRDLNNDEIPELLITPTDGRSSSLYAVYTIIDDTPVLVFESPGGSYKHFYDLLEDGKIYYYGGGNWRFEGLYSVSKDGELVCKEHFFIVLDPDTELVNVYRNTTGKEDVENSEKVTMEDMDAFAEGCASNLTTIESTPLGEFK